MLTAYYGKATSITFTPNGARILRASCDASFPPLLTLTFGGLHSLGDAARYDSESIRSIVQCIVQPDCPWTRASRDAVKKGDASFGKTVTGIRVPSGSSDTSRGSQMSASTTDDADSGEGQALR